MNLRLLFIVCLAVISGMFLVTAPALASNDFLLSFRLDTGCIKASLQERDDSTKNAYTEFRDAISTARSNQSNAFRSARGNKGKIKSAQADYKSALQKADSALNDARKNINNKFKAQVELCKR